MDTTRNLIANGIGTHEAAERLGVTHTQASRLFDSGVLTGVRTAIGRLIDPESVEAYRRQRDERKAARGRYQRPGAAND